MPAKNVTVIIDRESRSIKPGAIRGLDLQQFVTLNPGEQLLLEIPGEIDVPLSPSDLIFIRGGEQFSIADGNPPIEDNPRLRKPLTFTLNEIQIPENQQPHHAKITGAQLKALAGNAEVDLWADLDGIADELIEDGDRLVLQKNDQFITVPKDPEDKFYEVTVILDGDAVDRRFPVNMKVREAMRKSLPPADKPKVDEFDIVDGNLGTNPLNPELTLKEAGVRDGHVLSITKKNGGGG